MSKRRRMIGGGDPHKIWVSYLNEPNFVNYLMSDPSLHRLGIEKSDTDTVKQIFIESDPTTNKQYFKWILDGYRDGGNHLLEDVKVHMKNSLKQYSLLLVHHKIEGFERDIAHYCGLWGCERKRKMDGLFSLLSRFEEIESKSTREQRVRSDAKRVYEDDEILVISPQTVEASIFYGKGTKWCTSAKDEDDNMFDEYNDDGPLYVIIPKHPTRPQEKYQLHIATITFMDEMDEEISTEDLEHHQASINKLLRVLVTGQKESSMFVHNEDKLTSNGPLLLLLFENGVDPMYEVGGQVLYGLIKTIDNGGPWDQRLFDVLRRRVGKKTTKSVGDNALHILIHQHVFVKFLLEFGLDPNQRNKNGETPLRRSFDAESTALLLKYGADPNAQNNEGVTPLQTAMYSNTENVSLLLKAGADPNIPNNDGETPLHEVFHLGMIALLLEAGADPNTQDKHGRTPLHRLMLSTNKDLTPIILLLDAGANPNLSDRYEKLPIDYTTNEAMIALLKDYMK
jgi:ankyrin repeat protein